MSKASVYFDLDHLHGTRDAAEVKKQIDKIPGVISVSVNKNSDRVAVDFDTTGTSPNRIREQLGELGFGIVSEKFEEHVM